MFDNGQLMPYANKKLIAEIRAKQAEAVEDDYRVGMIEAYCRHRDKVCIIELWQKALGNDYTKPTRKDSNELTLILQMMKGWSKGKVERSQEFGNQQYWRKSDAQVVAEKTNDLPPIDDLPM